jgi:TorA maturation chaperone TorD
MQSLRAQEVDAASLRATTVLAPLHPEEQARADLYALLARLLFAAPDTELLAGIACADPISAGEANHPLDLAWEKLVLAAGIVDAFAVDEEFSALFISTSVPKINPYGSVYLAGFMNEKPLAALRSDLAQLHLARVAGVGEVEDHLGALCETMRVLITGGQGSHRQPLDRQKQFFDTHIAPWYARCLDDIRAAGEANFYRLVADFAQAFLVVEAEAFELGEACLAD